MMTKIRGIPSSERTRSCGRCMANLAVYAWTFRGGAGAELCSACSSTVAREIMEQPIGKEQVPTIGIMDPGSPDEAA